MTHSHGVVVTGASGQLGTAFRDEYPDATFLTRDRLDLNQPGLLASSLAAFAPSLVINCAAYTRVDRAEHEEDLATVVNGASVGAIAQFCQESGAQFVTFSTDYVFGGGGEETRRRPWLESDETAPINAYGRSKLEGEQSAVQAGGLVIRTSWMVSATHPNFVATMLNGAPPKGLSVVDDQWGCPTITSDLARATRQAIERDASGLLHLTNSGETTWFEFARAALAAAGMDPTLISPCGSADFETDADRPTYSVLGSERRASLGVEELPPWETSLPAVVEGLVRNGLVLRP